ncbi:MAG: TPM domain-containing protein [Bacteroidales bacterium]|nr:TPM domain-containing protein [Bacteroidales bacterium]
MSNAITILNREEDRRVVEAIKQAERNTSGEIKVHIENRCKGDVEERSLVVFSKLKLNETKLRNGVLIYLAVRDHKFAILGDEGINNVVGQGFWNDVKDLMLSQFKEGRFADGLEQGIQRCGEKLKTYFPYQSDDINEIPDEISYENN